MNRQEADGRWKIPLRKGMQGTQTNCVAKSNLKMGCKRPLRRQTVVSDTTPISSRDRVARVSRGNATSISWSGGSDVIAQSEVQRNLR